MTIYYTATFLILVIEMFAFCLLVVPLPSRWRRAIFKTLSTSPLITRALSTLKIVFGFIFVLFIDAVNRLQRIEETKQEDTQYHDYGLEASQKARKFYAQRNLYLCGFTLFLSLILERTSNLVITMLKHEEAVHDAKKETISSSKDQERLLDMEKSYTAKIDGLKGELDTLKKEERDVLNLKKQVEQQSEEYHRLAEEHRTLQKMVESKKSI
ncbi:B-cell receptor-associated 31-like protein [Backusella circina FSU 941]|nr:B-cell receptor-associated 31-like protein [Backusella circina FSU 941]